MAKKLSDLPIGTKVKHPASKYNGQPIVLQVGAQNHPGYPAGSTTFITERILSIKAFDAKEPASSNADRRSYGNNRYNQSNMRQWLNKKGTGWYSAQHSADQAPNTANVSYNPYDTEVGFLSGFAQEFIDAILPTNLTVVKASVDGGGTETTSDKVFLPSTTEVGLANEGGVAEGSKWPLFTSDASRQANPTAQAVSASNYTNANLTAAKLWYWWLRTPSAGNASYVRLVISDGSLSVVSAYNGYSGVRPALNLPSGLAVSDAPDTDGAYILEFNQAPNITGPNTTLGNKTAPFSVDYQVSDPENDAVSIVEKLNGTTIKTETNVTQGVNRTITLTSEQWATLPLNETSSITIEATESKGAKSTRMITFVKVNAAPSATAVEPKGDLSNLAIVDTLTPIFVHKFTDPDTGDSQSAYQYVINNQQDEVVHDSGKKVSTQSFYQLPTSVAKWGDRLSWKVRVWDRYDVPSEYSFAQWFMPNRPPNVSNVQPGSNNAEAPAGASLNPEVTWDFEDLDLEAQAGYQVRIYKLADDALAYDSSRVNQAVKKHQVPQGRLLEGAEYYTVVTVWDPNGLSKNSDRAYFRTNATPSAPILTGPVDNYRTTLRPTLIGIVGTDPENDGMHFRMQISTDPTFATYAYEKSSETDRTGWQVNGYDIPTAGVKNDQQGQNVAYTMQADLDRNKTYYWRMAAVDASTGARGEWSGVRRIRAGDELIYKNKTPINTGSVAARRILFAADLQLPTDGTTKATVKVEFANNALDVSPTWEDGTAKFLAMDYYDFTNETKTASDFAIGYRVTIKANDSMDPISISADGLTFD
ncbi:DUF6273 domain-containing protein [Sporosarcina sp. P33]|uniref:DUF6273 domain-containing protein n=1 Tax=Sporosarcina sp. P33 TaxID=1930764 RepID=UPI0009BE9867|nr:DUF6273 domain-containing protein [Sporosarcina sp. P33]ARD47560.1 hypothetical protein SporoP33_04455 [Sporosarcina sp. P33]